MEQNSAVLEIVDSSEEPSLKKVAFSDLTLERMMSFRSAIDDFVKRSGSPDVTIDGTWAIASKILCHQIPGNLWWVLDGDKVSGYFITNFCADLDGKTSVLIAQGWASSDLGSKRSKAFLKMVVKDALDRGASRCWFMSRRNDKVYSRWLGDEWGAVGTIFERS